MFPFCLSAQKVQEAGYGGGWGEHSAWTQLLALPSDLGQHGSLSGPQFLHLQNGQNNPCTTPGGGLLGTGACSPALRRDRAGPRSPSTSLHTVNATQAWPGLDHFITDPSPRPEEPNFPGGSNWPFLSWGGGKEKGPRELPGKGHFPGILPWEQALGSPNMQMRAGKVQKALGAAGAGQREEAAV